MPPLDKTIQFRASAEEKAHLSKGAADAGMKMSPYLRSVVLSRTVVVVGESVGVVVIPATDSPTAQDNRIMAAVQAAIERLNGEASGPAASDVIAVTPPDPAPAAQPPTPATAGAPSPADPAEPPAAPPSAAPASEQPPSPSEGERMAGAAGSQEPPAALPAAGAIPGSGESLEPGGPGACPNCGGTNGQHQSFCEEIRGEPPVTGTQQPSTPPEPEGSVIESKEQFVARRVGEGENQIVAEAEWRRLTSSSPAPSGQAPATGMVACSVCGTTKSAAVYCPDCGAPPQ